MINEQAVKVAVSKAEKILSGFELEFFQRIWASELDRYRARLRAIGFEGHAKVLDAGFGNGQWTICLTEMNGFVDALDFAESKVRVGRILKEELQIKNLELHQGSVEELPFDSDSYDAVFCYSVIFLTDYRRTLSELYRVLKPGGRLYLTANGLGWYLMCLIEEHNKSQNYDPRLMASDTIAHSMNYFTGVEKLSRGKQLFVTRELLEDLLSGVGSTSHLIAPEGTINVKGGGGSLSFYKHEKYLGKDFVFEVLCSK